MQGRDAGPASETLPVTDIGETLGKKRRCSYVDPNRALSARMAQSRSADRFAFMSYDEDVRRLRDACAWSQERLPLSDLETTEVAVTRLANGPYLDFIGKELKRLLVSDTPTSFDVGDIRKIASTLELEQAISSVELDAAAALTAIAGCIPVGTSVRPPEHENWEKAIDVGRCLSALNLLPQFNSRLKSVCEAGRYLRNRGYDISVKENAYTFAEGEIERATSQIVERFTMLGSANILSSLFQVLKQSFPVDFGLYLPGRRYAPGTGERPPSVPFGFLLNLAVKAPVNGSACPNPAALWGEAVALAVNIAAALNLEPFSGFSFINAAPRQVESALREMALFDHLFAVRQWRLPFTQIFLTEFFSSDYDQVSKTKLGWVPRDAVTLSRAVEYFATRDPNIITANVLRQGGMSRTLLDRMLPYFSHEIGTANAEYTATVPVVWTASGEEQAKDW